MPVAGNATLYRHFRTRGDLLVAVYADEVNALCGRGTSLLAEPSAADALFAWLDDFVVHVATKRALALAVTDRPEQPRTELFEGWHAAMTGTAEALLRRAVRAGDVRADLPVADLLALASGAAMAASGPEHARALVRLLRDGVAAPGGDGAG